MISLARVSAKMGRTYYTQDSYYTKSNSLEQSEWFGKGAEREGLQGNIDAKVFQDLLDVQTKANKRVALDITLSAPKSVSLACLVGGDERILEAHKTAVNTTLGVVEDRFSWTRVGSKDNRQIEIAGNILAAKFLHDVSRAKDPQLHTHCVVLNKVHRADGNSRSFHNDGVFNNAKFLGLVYQNELAHEVKKLGYDIQVNPNGTFEIDGYSLEQLQGFSKRTKKIKELGCTTKKQERIEKMIDRPAKGKAIAREILQEKWIEESHAVKIVHPVPHSESYSNAVWDTNNQVQNHIAKVHLEDGTKHVTERDVRFKQEDLEKFVLSHKMGSASFKTYQSELTNLKLSNDWIEYQKGYFTTKDALVIEKNIIDSIKIGKSKFYPIAPDIAEKLNQEKDILTLTNGQRNALVTSLQSQDQFIAWQGVAGSGKTYALDILRNIAEDRGIHIRGFAPSAEAAQVLQHAAKIESKTVASLLVQSNSTQSAFGLSATHKKEIWVVDEAGLLCARDCEKLMRNALTQNARVILIGDTKQMSAIEAGNPFKLVQEHGIQTVHLDESRRQKTINLKQSVDLIAQDKILDGLNKIKNCVHEIEKSEKRIEFIKNEYVKLSSKDQENTLILSSSNRERLEITNKIRDSFLDQGKIKSEIKVKQLVPKDQTRSEAQSILNYKVDDILMFHKDYKKYGIEKNKSYSVSFVDKKNEQLVIQEPDSPTLNQIIFSPRLDGFLSYTQRDIKIGVGDKIKCTKNDYSLGIRNGQDFVATKTSDDEIILKSQQGREIKFSTKTPLHIDYNYVHTVYSSQGKTCDKVIISEDKNFGKEMLYVALSRAKYDVQIVSENREQFLRSNHVSSQKLSATNLVKEVKNDISMTHTQSTPKKEVSWRI